MLCTAQFKEFVGRLQLTETQRKRITSASDNVASKLATHFDIPKSKIYLQGSFANGSSVRPAPSKGGEYDVDLVVEGPFGDMTPAEALNSMRKALRDTGFKDRIVADHAGKRPCIRLEYAAEGETVGFHVDVVPARPHPFSFIAPLEVPKPADQAWSATAPAEYTTWAKGLGSSYIRTVQILKRWRDENQSARGAIKSIVQVLISKHLDTTKTGDADRVAAALRGIATQLALNPSTPPRVENPVLPSENLAASWPTEDYKRFVKLVGEAADLAEKAREAATTPESTKLWNKLLGSSFTVIEADTTASAPPPPIDARRTQEAPRSEWA
jgi:hypothetical protein